MGVVERTLPVVAAGFSGPDALLVQALKPVELVGHLHYTESVSVNDVN